MTAQLAPTAADLRAALARARVPIYVVAARVGAHPATLSRRLNGHWPLSEELARRLLEVIDAEARERPRAS